MPDMHWFLGGKGGTGKTLLALAVAIYRILQGRKVLIIDLNFHNADLAAIMRSIAKGQGAISVPLGDTGFRALALRHDVGQTSRIQYLVSPQPGGDFFGRIPLGVAGMYESLDIILAAMETGDDEREPFQATDCIVDTPLHPSNLLPVGPNAPASMLEYESVRDYTPSVWFNWTIAAIYREDELAAAEDGFNWMSKGGWLTLPENLIHVINPYVLTNPVPLFAPWPGDEVTIQSLEKFLNKTPVDNNVPISFLDFAQYAWRGIDDYKGDDREEFLRGIVEEIKDRAERDTHRRPLSRPWLTGTRPKNVFPIPYFSRVLTGYTDALGSEDHDFNSLALRLGHIYDAVKTYFERLS
jgi:hypothetical protein